MTRFLEQFRGALQETPGLRCHLETICDRIDRQGQLPKQVKLGQGLHHYQELSPLRRLFGDGLRETASGIVRVDIEHLLRRLSVKQRNGWSEALYAVLGREQVNRPAERRENESDVTRILERWMLEFSDLPEFGRFLHDRLEHWRRKVAGNGSEATQRVLFLAGKTVRSLRVNEAPIGLAEVAARCCGDSKALQSSELWGLVGDGLLCSAGDIPPYTLDQRNAAIRLCGVTENPTAVRVTLFGPVVYRKNGVTMDWIKRLWQMGEAAVLTWENLQGIESMGLAEEAPDARLITCENETPFCRLTREEGNAVVVYTEGYPNTAVKRLLSLLAPDLEVAWHWGDTDLDGLRIAGIVDEVLPVNLWRCDLPDLARCREGLIALDGAQLQRSRQFGERRPDFRFSEELAFTIENGWLEQESWCPDAVRTHAHVSSCGDKVHRRRIQADGSPPV